MFLCFELIFANFLLLIMATYRGVAFDGLMDKIHQAQGASFGGIILDRFFSSLKRLLEKKKLAFSGIINISRNILKTR